MSLNLAIDSQLAVDSQFVDLAKYRSLSCSSVVSCEGANGWEAVRFARFTFAAHFRTSRLELSKEGDLEQVLSMGD